MRALVIKNSMNGGEISPLVLARTDLAKYPNALERCENFIPLITGGITRRPGTRFVLPALGPSRFIGFEFSTTQTFALEFGNKQMRFFTIVNGVAGAVLLAGVPYLIATPYDTAADDLWDIKVAQQGDVMYITHPNHPPFKLSRITDTNWRLNQVGFQSPPTHAFDQDVSNGAITLTPAATQGNGVVFTASAPVFISGDIGKRIISGAGSAVITALGGVVAQDPATKATLYPTATCDISSAFAGGLIAAGNWFLRGAPQGYLEYANHEGVDPTKVHLERKLGAGQTKDVFTFAHFLADGQAFPNDNDQDCFRSIDVGRYLVAAGAVGLIVSLVNANHVMVRRYSPIEDTMVAAVNGDIVVAPQSGGTWSVEDPAFSAANGYPSACTFMQDRLILSGTSALPLQSWGSRTGDYENFAKGGRDSDGLDFGVNSRTQSPIRAVEEYRGNLGVFTPREEYMVGAGVISVSNASPQALTPGNVTAVRQSKNGSSRVQPQIIQNMLLYIWRSKLAASEMQYNIYQANFGSRNLNILHDLITATGIKESTWQQFPNFVDWFTTLGSGIITNLQPGGGPARDIVIPTAPTVGFNSTGNSGLFGVPVLPLTITRPIPVGAQIGDLIVAKVSVKGIFPGVGAQINPIPTPAGWNLLAPFHGGAGQIGTNLFYRFVDGTEGPNITFSYAGPAYNFAGFQINAALVLIRNANPAAPLDAITYSDHVANSPDCPADSVLTTKVNDLILVFMEPVNPNANQGGAGQITPGTPAGLTPQFNTQSPGGALTDTVALWSEIFAGPGASGAFSSPTGWPIVQGEQIVIAIARSPVGLPVTTTAPAAGQLIGLTYEVEQQVWGWARHFSGQDLAIPDNWVSACSVQDPTTEQSDRLWVVTQRQVNNQTVYSIEIFDPALNTDCASVLASAVKVTSIAGLGYLQGRSVWVKADGAFLGIYVVPANGIIDFHLKLPGGAFNVEAGLPYNSFAMTVRPEIGQGGQTIQGVKKGWNKVWLRVYNSINVMLGAGTGPASAGFLPTLQRLLGRRKSDPMGAPVAAFTGDVALEGNLGEDFDGRIVIQQDQPFPLTVLAPFGILSVGQQ